MKPAFDFKAMEKRARLLGEASLRWCIRDCQEAIAAYPMGENAPYYMDEIHVYVAEIRRREEKARARQAKA